MANAGTALTSGMQWGIPNFSGTTLMASTGAGTTGQVLTATTSGLTPEGDPGEMLLQNLTCLYGWAGRVHVVNREPPGHGIGFGPGTSPALNL